MKQKHRPGLKQDEVDARVGVAQSPIRCPYCHDSCTSQTAGAIVCQECLSRHHGACWREGTCCASCGSTRSLKGGPPEVDVAPAELALLKKGLSREAVERVARRCEVDEAHATRVLLETAARELERADAKLPPWAVIALAALAIPILAILLS